MSGKKLNDFTDLELAILFRQEISDYERVKVRVSNLSAEMDRRASLVSPNNVNSAPSPAPVVSMEPAEVEKVNGAKP